MDYEFGWKNYIRKISVVILLSDPEEYDGGEFEICLNGNLDSIESMKPKAGDVIFFASWMPHRVAPVTRGTRKSLVAWVMGKREC
jgi:PKHD-type hydroxylase